MTTTHDGAAKAAASAQAVPAQVVHVHLAEFQQHVEVDGVLVRSKDPGPVRITTQDELDRHCQQQVPANVAMDPPDEKWMVHLLHDAFLVHDVLLLLVLVNRGLLHCKRTSSDGQRRDDRSKRRSRSSGGRRAATPSG